MVAKVDDEPAISSALVPKFVVNVFESYTVSYNLRGIIIYLSYYKKLYVFFKDFMQDQYIIDNIASQLPFDCDVIRTSSD